MRMRKGFQSAMTRQTSFSEDDGGSSLQPPYLFIYFLVSHFLPHKHLLAEAALRHNETKSSRVGVSHDMSERGKRAWASENEPEPEKEKWGCCCVLSKGALLAELKAL